VVRNVYRQISVSQATTKSVLNEVRSPFPLKRNWVTGNWGENAYSNIKGRQALEGGKRDRGQSKKGLERVNTGKVFSWLNGSIVAVVGKDETIES